MLKKIWEKVKKPVCGAIMAVNLILTLGFVGSAEIHPDSGDEYFVKAAIAVVTVIVAGIAGGIFEKGENE